jgi:hypothetical protein
VQRVQSWSGAEKIAKHLLAGAPYAAAATYDRVEGRWVS